MQKVPIVNGCDIMHYFPRLNHFFMEERYQIMGYAIIIIYIFFLSDKTCVQIACIIKDLKNSLEIEFSIYEK